MHSWTDNLEDWVLNIYSAGFFVKDGYDLFTLEQKFATVSRTELQAHTHYWQIVCFNILDTAVIKLTAFDIWCMAKFTLTQM